MENEYYGARVALLGQRMSDANIDAFFTLAAPSMRYLTGFTGEEGFLLALQDGMHLIVDGRFTTQAREECPWVDVIEYKGQFTSALAGLLTSRRIHWLGFEKERISYIQAEQMRVALPSISMIATEQVVEGMRAVKDVQELELMRSAGRIADTAYNAMICWLRPGMTENEAAALLEYEMRKAGAQGTSFSTIVGSGARGALPHGIASDKVIGANDIVVIDFGVCYKGYMSDCTRTVAFGDQPRDVMDAYARLLEAQQLGLGRIQAGMSSRSVDTAVRDKLGEHDLSKYFTHGLGHGVGLEIHEAPRLSQGTDTVLEAGHVVTCEPGIYLPGRYGMRIEDTVIVTGDGYESLTALSKSLVIV